MKTQISHNIRKFRLNSNMTQEILAEKIGVSVQAVSRWENAVTLPDITLLPIIADVFNITIDTLFGINKDDAQLKINETYTKLSKSKYIQDRITIAKELCNEYPTLREPKFIMFDELAGPFSTPEQQKEGIKLGYELLATLRSDEYWRRDSIISGMIAIIPKEELCEFIGKFTHNSSLDSMLLRRHYWNNEQEKWFEKYAKMIYVNLRNCFNAYADRFLKKFDRSEAKTFINKRIKLLNILSEADCDIDSVVGDGKEDIFIIWRIEWGIRLAAYSDNADTAVDILRKILQLYKKLEKHPENEPLDNRSALFAPIKMYVKYVEKWDSYSIVPDMSDIGMDGFSIDFLKNRLEKSEFDWLKDNGEFQSFQAELNQKLS